MAYADWSEVASDDFNRGSGAIGTDWTTLWGYKPTLDTNAVQPGSSGDDGGCYWNQDTFADDQYSEIEVVDDTNGEHFIGVMVRCGDEGSGGDGYFIWTDGDNETSLYRLDNGTPTFLDGLTDPNLNDDLALEVIDDTLQMYINQSATDTPTTDSTYTSGYAGIMAAYGTDPCGDNWSAGDVVSNVSVTPGVAAVTMAGYAPTILVSQSATPGVSQLLLTAYAPTISLSDNKKAEPGVSAVTITAYAPTIEITENVTITPAQLALSLTGYAPTIAISADTPVFPGVSALALTGYAPTVTVSDHQEAQPGVCQLVLTGYQITPTTSNHQWVYPGPCEMTITMFRPEIFHWMGCPPARYWRQQLRTLGGIG